MIGDLTIGGFALRDSIAILQSSIRNAPILNHGIISESLNHQSSIADGHLLYTVHQSQ
jgi:hypothetical protein